ncbi:YeiH family putative sulfate export transporter [Rhodobacter sp. HX-7-19]|uniref:YeiH family putative sulfate export transporter n=1 Tax=Paragemmobacter kunshanensis TaxID=2583234 RepID=A0A6M1U5T4_9RHOB|nr:YeiH family protein [Rhodobacter kunshanensis]NGQ93144.1 YeiH family putative sulfate export transporter [Rhodobacter kunshanensis]
MGAFGTSSFGASSFVDFARNRGPGLLVSAVVALAAQFLSEHYGAPAMLMALLLGIAFHFLAEEGKCVPGVEFAARTVLRVGVALLGARISVDLMVGLGAKLIILLVVAVALTITFGLAVARLLGRGWRFGLLTGGSVAICGASAAMAISAVLPRNEHSERNLIFTVLSVTVLSTLAMIIYPILAATLGLDDVASGVFLGGTIHDVAQVVGAGFSVSDESGEVATLVKLIRVTMLAPVVLIVSLVIRNRMSGNERPGKQPPIIPFFVLAFLGFATLNTMGAIPALATDLMSGMSRWALLISVAAVGMKTSLKRILEVGRQAIILVVAETLFISSLVLVGVTLLD